jgi:hypothetical protein
VKHSGVWVGSTLIGEPVMEGLDYKDKLFFSKEKKRNVTSSAGGLCSFSFEKLTNNER